MSLRDPLTARQRYATSPKGRANHAKNNRTDRLRIKRMIIDAYGGRCTCCQETELVFLTIDHIDGGGSTVRSVKGYNTTAFYRQLRNAGFPPGHRVLCFNCNWAEAHGGCPHKELQHVAA